MLGWLPAPWPGSAAYAAPPVSAAHALAVPAERVDRHGDVKPHVARKVLQRVHKLRVQQLQLRLKGYTSLQSWRGVPGCDGMATIHGC